MNTNGVANKIASKRSKTPPCPGIKLPESFTPALLLSIDSERSPIVAVITIISAKNIHSRNDNCNCLNNNDKRYAAIKAKSNPPANPSQVFLGEILSNNLCFPKNEPVK